MPKRSAFYDGENGGTVRKAWCEDCHDLLSENEAIEGRLIHPKCERKRDVDKLWLTLAIILYVLLSLCSGGIVTSWVETPASTGHVWLAVLAWTFFVVTWVPATLYLLALPFSQKSSASKRWVPSEEEHAFTGRRRWWSALHVYHRRRKR